MFRGDFSISSLRQAYNNRLFRKSNIGQNGQNSVLPSRRFRGGQSIPCELLTDNFQSIYSNTIKTQPSRFYNLLSLQAISRRGIRPQETEINCHTLAYATAYFPYLRLIK